VPETLPLSFVQGEDTEAQLYAALCKKGWDETPGAIEWLVSRTGSRKQLAA